MKGKRKAKTTKWFLKQQFKSEAKYLLANRSLKAQQRFLDATSTLDIELEPVGALAGVSLISHRVEPRT
jgi:myo-inositol-1(or 4)-monophosphatase